MQILRVESLNEKGPLIRFAHTGLKACASAFVSVFCQKGVSPFQADVLRLVADRNCVAMRRGGEHRKANDQSQTFVNSIRPVDLASLLANGEA